MFLCLVRDSLSPSLPGVLEAVARACSPRVEPHGNDVVMCDGRGLTRVIGEPTVIANEMRRMAWNRGMGVRVAVAGTHTAAWMLAHARPGITVVPPGTEAASVARLPLAGLLQLPECRPVLPSDRRRKSARPHPRNSVLDVTHVRDALATLDRWGLATLGDLARLSRADVMSRLGLLGERLHQAAWGEDVHPLVAVPEAKPFIERIELDWPVEGLEPLSFVLARACESLSGALERADRGAVTVTTRLTLVTKAVYTRTLTLPAPMRDAKVLRTLILLDLESNPPEDGRGVDVVEVELGVTPGRILQKSLLAHDVPTAEDVATLIARLNALMGESRVGAPVLRDSHDPRRLSMQPFTAPASSNVPSSSTRRSTPPTPSAALRRFRHPPPVRVVTERGRPIQVTLSERHHLRHDRMSQQDGRPAGCGAVVERAGPWRTSGQWWTADRDTWDRDEWDVLLDSGVIYRLARNRMTNCWEAEGILD